jgi:hypothetical protein
MKDKDIREKTKNELIEQFYVKHGGKPHLVEDIHFYESDWNMLMSVVEKIESLGNNVGIWDKDCMINNGSKDEIDCQSTSKIKAVYEAVIEFIKLYNENKNP